MPTEAQRFQATGKRKTAVARVMLLPGTGTITVNKRTIEDYFRGRRCAPSCAAP